MKVILDTTELWNDYWLRSAPLRMLREFLKTSGAKLVLPDVVVREVLRHYRKQVEDACAGLKRNLEALEGLVLEGSISKGRLPDSEALIEIHKSGLDQLLAELGADVVSSNVLDVTALLERALSGRRPFNGDGKKGFRDSLIWEHVLRLAKTDYVVFVTRNTNDFCAGKDGELHPQLREDLVARNVTAGRIEVIVGLGEFIRWSAEMYVGRQLDIETALTSGTHPTISLADILRQHEEDIVEQVDLSSFAGNCEARLQPTFKRQRCDFRVNDMRAVGLSDATIGDIQVSKLGTDLAVSFSARFEAELDCWSNAYLYTKHDFDDIDQEDTVRCEIEVQLEIAVDPKTGEVSDFSVVS
jgi:hypothetical protein